MPVRAVNLKIVVPRQSSELAAARALWTTHDAVNKATRYYEEMFLLCRQQAYQTRDGSVTAEQIVTQLDKLIENARKRNGLNDLSGEGDEAERQKVFCEARQKLRILYETIVPPAVGKTGKAQAVGHFISPLLDPKSDGLTKIFKKIEDVPAWVERAREGDADAIKDASEWLKSPAGEARMKAESNKTEWKTLAKDGKPAWLEAFFKDLEKNQKKIQVKHKVVRELRELGVMPLFRPYFASRIEGYKPAVSRWDRLSARLAVAHLLSWESWVNRAREEHRARSERLENFKRGDLITEAEATVKMLRNYEQSRSEQLRDEAALEVDQVRTTARTIRGWGSLREKWLKNLDASENDLIDIVNSEQDRLRGKFGDTHLFRWLAKPENRQIWQTAKTRDDLSLFVTLRSIELLVERSQETATMTFPDAVQHPRSAQWEPFGGTNLKTYKLNQTENKSLCVTLPLLADIDENLYTEVTHEFPLAKSGQLSDVCLIRDKKKYKLQFKNQTGENCVAKVGSADLMMNWYDLRQRTESQRSSGDIGSVFFKVALDLEAIEPVGDPKKTPPTIHHFQTAGGKNTKHVEHVEDGFRVLSIDLGLRSFATCSVFELTSANADGKLFFPIADLHPRAVHERSFTLRLDGEQADKETERWRQSKSDELRKLRGWLSRYRSLRALKDAEPAQRRENLIDIIDRARNEGWRDELPILEGMVALTEAPEPIWGTELLASLRRYRQALAPIVSHWRSANRARSAETHSGKSIWAIDHLTSTRRFLQSWSLLSDKGDIRRLDNQGSGVFAKHILDHLDALKEDRLKTGADLIVQAARGYRRNKSGKWEKAYQPCHAILFEDLSRYRMRTDRPRRENNQLMKWAHRAMPKEVKMQAELHGIHVTETGAAFSSRFHAATRTPGIRMHALRKRDLGDEFFLGLIERQNPGVQRSNLQVGQLVSLDGGELFVCPTKTGVKKLHADINAAQNLQRRFFTRHEDAFRIVTRKVIVNGEELWVPKTLGKRLLGGLKGYGVLQPTGHASGSCKFVEKTKQAWAKIAGTRLADGDDSVGSIDDEELALLEEEALERTGEILIYFRDPSGIVWPRDLWYPQREFWGAVKGKTVAAVKRSA